MKHYRISISVEFDALDDVQARERLVEFCSGGSACGGDWTYPMKVTLREVFKNKPPRGVRTKEAT